MRAQVLTFIVVSFMSIVWGADRQWCPPEKLKEVREKRTSTMKTAVLSEIHGQVRSNTTNGRVFPDGHLLSRFIFHYIGSFGFDKVYLNVVYNATVHKNPPTIEEAYPSELTCVTDWQKIGALEWNPIPHNGPKASNMIDGDCDWVLGVDFDEYLVPVNWHPNSNDWCDPKNPTLIVEALNSMMTIAASKILYDFPTMLSRRNHNAKCNVGQAVEKSGKCNEIASIGFPVFFWTYQPKLSTRTDMYPVLKSHHPAAYASDVGKNNHTEDSATKYQVWKSIYSVKHPKGVSMLSPRKYHSGLTLELAHIKSTCVDCEGVLRRDNRLHGLHAIFNKCMSILP